MKLIVDIQGYWHAGGGRGAGAVVDAVVHRDSRGLPVLPGRHLKGLLRDALERAEAWEWEGFEGLADALFGQASETATGEAPPRPGSLRVGDAGLPEELASWLGGTEQGRALREELFQAIYATAVDPVSGTALDHSLRGMEVAIPLKLEAVVSEVPGRQPPDGWRERLREALHLVDAVGAHRTRGLGRARLTLEDA